MEWIKRAGALVAVVILAVLSLYGLILQYDHFLWWYRTHEAVSAAPVASAPGLGVQRMWYHGKRIVPLFVMQICLFFAVFRLLKYLLEHPGIVERAHQE